jgi:hypothetical protein
VLVRNPAPPASGGGWLELYACDAAGCERVYRSETAVAELIEWDEAGCWLWEWREGDGRSIGVRVEPGAEVQRVTLEQGPGVVPIAAEGGRLYALVRAPDGPHELVSYTWRAT